MASRYYIEAGPRAYLIPIWIDPASEISGTVYDSLTSPVRLVVGQRVYFKDRVIVKPGMDFLLITAP
jgi:hypothetical protein